MVNHHLLIQQVVVSEKIRFQKTHMSSFLWFIRLVDMSMTRQPILLDSGPSKLLKLNQEKGNHPLATSVFYQSTGIENFEQNASRGKFENRLTNSWNLEYGIHIFQTHELEMRVFQVN